MAVTFTSHGYDTTTGNPYTEIAWADAHPLIGSGMYGVRSGSDWKVTAVTGADRTVSIAEGFGWGYGVTDKTLENETIQLDAITSGSRWDLIVARRDWTPTAGETKFMKINGGSVKAIPGGRLQTPGGIDDQPLALVQVTAGQTQPTAIVDLRCWATNGGVVAKDDLAKNYMNRLGTELYINGIEWRYIPGANDVPEWVTGNSTTTLTPIATSGYATTGQINITPEGLKSRVTVDLTFERTGGNFTLAGDTWPVIATVIPVQARGASIEKILPASLVGGTNNIMIHAALVPSSGQVKARAVGASHLLTTGSQFSINATYYI